MACLRNVRTGLKPIFRRDLALPTDSALNLKKSSTVTTRSLLFVRLPGTGPKMQFAGSKDGRSVYTSNLRAENGSSMRNLEVFLAINPAVLGMSEWLVAVNTTERWLASRIGRRPGFRP
jgi:hypothetical protein